MNIGDASLAGSIRLREMNRQRTRAVFCRLTPLARQQLVAKHYLSLARLAESVLALSRIALESPAAADVIQMNMAAFTEAYEEAFGQAPPWEDQPSHEP
jgi:hypothetical protein